MDLGRLAAEKCVPVAEDLPGVLEGREDPEDGRATLLASEDDLRILVTGPEEQIAIVEELVGQIDLPVLPDVSRLTRAIDVHAAEGRRRRSVRLAAAMDGVDPRHIDGGPLRG